MRNHQIESYKLPTLGQELMGTDDVSVCAISILPPPPHPINWVASTILCKFMECEHPPQPLSMCLGPEKLGMSRFVLTHTPKN